MALLIRPAGLFAALLERERLTALLVERIVRQRAAGVRSSEEIQNQAFSDTQNKIAA